MLNSLEWECGSCHSAEGPEFLMLGQATSPHGSAIVGIWSSCPVCHSEQPIGLPLELVDTVPVLSQMSTIGMHLHARTGLAVFRDRPDNPRLAFGSQGDDPQIREKGELRHYLPDRS